MHQGDQGRVGAHRKPLPRAVPGKSHHPRTPSLELPRHSRAPCAGAVAQASGFYCPGYDDDAVNEPPGCKPIPIGSGGFRTTEEKTVITQTIELDMSVDEFDEVARANTVERLAKLYNVSADSISLSVEAGSLVLSFTITPPDDSSVEVLQATVLTANSSVLSRALGTNVTITQMGCSPVFLRALVSQPTLLLREVFIATADGCDAASFGTTGGPTATNVSSLACGDTVAFQSSALPVDVCPQASLCHDRPLAAGALMTSAHGSGLLPEEWLL